MEFPIFEVKEKIKLLLVDDSDEFRYLVIAYLKMFPFEISEAPDGLVALEMMKESNYDVVLMDYRMPGMDGATTTRMFRDWEKNVGSKHLLIVALSAFCMKRDRDEFFSAGCDEYLTKPIRRIDLVGALTELLKRHDLKV